MKQSFKRIAPHLYKRQYETSNGEWSTRYYGIFVDWKEKRRKFSLGPDLIIAKRKLKMLEGQSAVEHDFDQDKVRGITFFPWIERFFQVKASKKSLNKDRVSCEKLKTFWGDCSLDSITTSQIEVYKQKRLAEVTRYKKVPQPATINRELACLRTILILAARDGLIDKVPYICLFEENNERHRTASPEELDALLKVSPLHLREILFLVWSTGVRISEALELTWNRVDLKNDFIGLGAEDTKKKYPRIIPISPGLKNLLLEIHKREKGGKVVKMTDRVFLFRGKPISRIDRSWNTACRNAEIEGLWVHDLRATFATRKIVEGFDRDWVKMITGHKTDHVFRRYNRPSPENLKAVVAQDYVPMVFTQRKIS